VSTPLTTNFKNTEERGVRSDALKLQFQGEIKYKCVSTSGARLRVSLRLPPSFALPQLPFLGHVGGSVLEHIFLVLEKWILSDAAFVLLNRDLAELPNGRRMSLFLYCNGYKE
jgi:hypothetical protein